MSDVKAVKGRFTHHHVAACSFILDDFSDHPYDCCDTESSYVRLAFDLGLDV